MADDERLAELLAAPSLATDLGASDPARPPKTARTSPESGAGLVAGPAAALAAELGSWRWRPRPPPSGGRLRGLAGRQSGQGGLLADVAPLRSDSSQRTSSRSQ